MAFQRQCSKCGFYVTDNSLMACPQCGSNLVPLPSINRWIGALLQVVASTTFMLVFGFPRPMIAIFAGIILMGAAISSRLKPRAAGASPANPQRTIVRPTLFRVLSIGTALSTFAVIVIALFGFVMFMNSWDRWHRYEGQPYRRSEFQVVRAYYQTHTKGGPDIYASGTVDGQREWMDLQPSLHMRPHDQNELDARVPRGTSISVYLFPGLKGRSRVQMNNGVLPGEASQREAMAALKYGLSGLAVTAFLLLVLIRLRRECFVEAETALSLAQTAGR
jgi:hypothetical protein